MTSGHILAKGEPGPDEILGALREAVVDNPRLTEMPAEKVACNRSLRRRWWRRCWTPSRPRREPSRPRSCPRRATPRECETNQSLEKGAPSRGVSRETGSWPFTTPKDQRRYRRGVVTAVFRES